MCAMPATRVENTSGAMIILISRRKTSVTNLKLAATGLMSAAVIWVLMAQPAKTQIMPARM